MKSVLIPALAILAAVAAVGCSDSCPSGSNYDSLFCHVPADGGDAGVDAPSDAGVDAGVDATMDARPDARPDVVTDSNRSDADASTDSGHDAGSDAGTEAGDADAGRCASDLDCTDGRHCDTASGACVECLRDEHCAPGMRCDTTAHACVPGCGTGSTCPDGGMCCNAACADLQTSLANCGACNHPCDPAPGIAATCVDGMCGLDCPAGRGNCDGLASTGCEVDTTTDATHCGTCGTVCPTPPHASPTCTGSTCGFACLPGYEDCNHDASDGCEVNLLTDPRNCGSCNNVCTGGSCDGAGSCGACTSGMACSTGVACETGQLSCPASGAVCNRTGLVPAGTGCGTNRFCDASGNCNDCVPNSPCAVAGQACRTGTLDCSTGVGVCVASGNVAPGTSCPGGVCGAGAQAGTCVPCTTGATCSTGNACTTGSTVCSSGAPVCTPSGSQPPGTTCPGGVCGAGAQAGTCVPCTTGMACSTGNSCTTGAIVCSSGAAVCTQSGTQPPGTACSGGVCGAGAQAGTCVPCSAGASCTPATCQTGTIACSSGAPVCTRTGSLPAGTSCPGGVCGAFGQAGTCVPCTQGASCSPGTCQNGAIQCGSGYPVCQFTGYQTYTPCGSGGLCSGNGYCCSGNWGQYSSTVVNHSENALWTFMGVWCSYTNRCVQGNNTYSQSLLSYTCVAGGSTGSCTDPDATYYVTCADTVQCQYDCGGNCVPTSC